MNKTTVANYNEQIAAASSYIGQKLFAYIANGSNINNRIREKFAKSLIFIGDEGQIYNPLTNTYIGIGQTAYTNTVSYVEAAHEKIASLNKILSSSMVSAIYANWGDDEWDAVKQGNSNYYKPADTQLPSKIYATNEIVLKGIGNYDPTTKLAASREYANIKDSKNAGLSKIYKKNPNSAYSAFANSGITVTLDKGENRYLYSYTFTNKGGLEYITPEIFGSEDAFNTALNDYTGFDYTNQQYNIYLTDEQYKNLNDTKTSSNFVIYDYDSKEEIISNNISAKVFFEGLKPVYEDGYNVVGSETDKKHQLFKQSTNILTIDDKLTWSYIASAYNYTLNYAREYTDKRVANIYNELLGEQDIVIPVSAEQIKLVIPNKDAKLDADLYTWNWNDTTQKWEAVAGSDEEKESSSNLSVPVLNYASTFVKRETDTNAEGIATDVVTNEGAAYYFPWDALVQLSKEISAAQTTALNGWDAYKITNNKTDDDLYNYLKDARNSVINAFEYKYSVGPEDSKVEYKYTLTTNVTSQDTDNNKIFVDNVRFLNKIGAHDKQESTSDNYPLDYVFTLVNSENVIDDPSETKYYVVNSVASVRDINLVDGIQTLKEIAYILDKITDGTEGDANNGILLSYNIADNHRRIEDHEERLSKLEGGKNAVRSIYRDDKTTDKYVNIELQSSNVWNVYKLTEERTAENEYKLDIASYHTTPNIIGDPNTSSWFAFNGRPDADEDPTYLLVPASERGIVTGQKIPYGVMYAYSAAVNAWNNKVSGDETSAPVFNDYYSAVTGENIDNVAVFVNAVVGDENSIAFFDATHNKLIESKTDEHDSCSVSPAYVGDVGIGVNLNIAQTFTLDAFGNNGNDGYEVIDLLNSENINRHPNLSIVLPNYIDYDVNVLDPSEADVNANRFDEKPAALTPAEGETSVTITKANLRGALAAYAEYINTYLAEFNDNDVFVVTTEIKAIEDHKVGIEFELTYTVSGRDINNADYNEAIYTFNGTNFVLYDNSITFNPKDIITTTYYIRKKQTSRKQVDVNSDGLTNVEWVTTYVSNTVENVTAQLKDTEFKANQYAKNLINQLDSSYTVCDGMYVVGIEQVNGIVKPIVRDLPTDSIKAETKFWGNNDTLDPNSRYEAVTVENITDEIALDNPLFIKSGTEMVELTSIADVNEIKISETYTVTVGGANSNALYYKSDVESNLIYTLNEKRVPNGNLNNVKSSIAVGPEYARFNQYFVKVDKFVPFDGATLRYDSTETDWVATGVSVKEGDVYKLSDTQPDAKKEYITATSEYQSDKTGGKGGNAFTVTAHITKLNDATENNSGLVDAYDVKQTLESMFEWVDLSRWDLQENSGVNPINTESNE